RPGSDTEHHARCGSPSHALRLVPVGTALRAVHGRLGEPSLPPVSIEVMAGLALPIDAHLPAVVAALRAHRAAVLIAAPGAGKTTRVPPALADDGAVLVLQPRRVAARALARRVAEERDWTLGREV